MRYFPKLLDSDRLTRSLPLPVLTVSKDETLTFEAKPFHRIFLRKLTQQNRVVPLFEFGKYAEGVR
jgi:hypothetical protein